MKRFFLIVALVVGSFVVSQEAFAAFTERYVTTVGAGAHDGTTEANAWTFAEMIAAAPGAGVRVNMKSDAAYSVGITTIPSGAANALFVIRGYEATIGDLDNLGRNADGTLNTTNMPDVTITGIWTPGAFCAFQNLDITGALSSALIGSISADVFGFISCNVVNTQNNAAARTFQGDNGCFMIDSDFTCTGAAHTSVVDVDTTVFVKACRFKGTSTATLLIADSGGVLQSVFYGNGSSTGILFNAIAAQSELVFWDGCTFYGIGTQVSLPNTVNTGVYYAFNNYATDSSKWVDSLYQPTATVPLIEGNNRTRDVTTLLTGVESLGFGAVTTDTGGAETDYVDAAAGNFRLISTAPGLAVGLTPYMDIGAYQRQSSAGGGQKSWSN